MVLLAGSGEVYGAPARLPVDESAPLRPQNPYAVSKAACDLLGGQYADAYGLRVVRTRAFNHAGPGQSDLYVVGALSRQVAEAEAAGLAEVVIRTGNPDSLRDFTDVRDVVRAYRGHLPPAGRLQRVLGRTASVRDVLGCSTPPPSDGARDRPGARARPRRARDPRLGCAPGGGLGAGDPARADGGRRPRLLERAMSGDTIAVVI